MMHKTLLLLIALTAVASAQNGTSIMARTGIGELQTWSTPRTRGMGLVNATSVSETDISTSNPALWGFLTGIRLQGEAVMESEHYDRFNGGVSSTQLKGMHVGFPVLDDLALRIVAGFIPVSRADYKASVIVPAEAVGEKYSANYSGRGGITQFRVGGSIKPLPSLYLGAAYQYYFGSINRTADVVWDNENYFSAMQTRSTQFSGSGAMFGVLYTGMAPFTIGVALNTPVALSVSDQLDVSYTTHDSTFSGTSGTQDIPLRLEAGASYRITDALTASVEYGMQNWEKATLFEQGVTLYNTTKLGAGVEWRLGNHDSPLLHQVHLRAGFAQLTGYVGDGGQETTTLLTLGAGFPIIARNRVDMALEYGWRGSDGTLLGKRSLMRLSMSFTIGEGWFTRSMEE